MMEQLKDGRTDLIFDLLDNGYEPQSTDEYGVSLMQWCAYYGDVSAIKYLLSRGAGLDLLGENYDLNAAAFHGHWQLCQFLLEQGADPNYCLKDTGESILHAAISASNKPVTNLIVQILLHYGADPNVKTNNGQPTGAFMRDALTRAETPLHRAAAFGNEETINLLLANGADLSATDHNNETPRAWASWHHRPASIIDLLSAENEKLHPLHLEKMKSDHGSGWGAGVSIMRMGVPHLEEPQSM